MRPVIAAAAVIGASVLLFSGLPASAAQDPTITLAKPAAAAAGRPFHLVGRLADTGARNNKVIVLQRKSGSGWRTVHKKRLQDDGRYRLRHTEPRARVVTLRTKVKRHGVVLDRSRSRRLSVTRAVTPAPVPPPTVVGAVGDMCDTTPTSCSATGDVAAGFGARYYLVLGDTQYASGLPAEYALGYARSTWNRLLADTRPAIGNHELAGGADAAGYCGYFGALAHCPQHYYAYDIDPNWRAIVLDSNRPADPAQLAWLTSQLATAGEKNVVAYFHHPRWNSDTSEGDAPGVTALMRPLHAAHADLLLWGHDHLYARHAKLDGDGLVAPDGMRAFTVGTGGVALRESTPTPNPATQLILREHGALRLTLAPTTFSWEFHTVTGRVADSGTDAVIP